MNGRLKLIEQQLIGIDSAAFQNLCDIYLAFREEEFASINRTGSQFGKQKTVKGTPDTFFRLSDGSLRYVEYTTVEKGLVDKIKEDIDKCLDQSKTGVPANEVNKIIICFNSRLTVADETEITKYATSKNVRIELIGLDWLALEIYSKYLILAKDILGIPLDTGQLLPLSNFIEEYNNKAGKLSTPLDNQFLHRKTELQSIEEILSNNDILILSGFPGVGKTKIALEGLSKFLEANKDYDAYAISKKDVDISEDLRIHLQQDKNYILLVDDANRQLVNFKQILGVFREKRKGNIKLLITVRNYALYDVRNECSEFDPHEIVINKFSDDEIKELISSDSFQILNHKYQRKIIELADGNARLAVMAAKLAQQKQEIFLLDKVSDLYDSYFQNFIKDFDIFSNKTLFKTLGLISFFFTIDRSNKAFVEGVLKDFEIDYHEFNEAIDELHKRELIEIQYQHARVSEQVMATYFFYKSFIKDNLLSFKTLLFNYFPSWKNRFTDTIIPANNSFGYENVFEKINDILNEYLYSIYDDEEKIKDFFSLFWFYKREEMLAYFHSKISALPELENPIYDTSYETNQFTWDSDKTLDFLSNLFNHYTESYLPSLELAFEYARKKPDALPELIKLIREKIAFDEMDEDSGFIRQVELFKFLTSKFKERKFPFIESFFALSATFLSHHFQITKGGRNHSFMLYQYPMPFYEVTQEFRKNIWETLIESYEEFPEQTFGIIKDFKPGFKEAIPEMLQFDLSFIVPFIENNLDPKKFENTYFVSELVSWLNMEKLPDRGYQKLKSSFYSTEYDYFRKLDWNRFRGKQDFEFDNYDEFEKLKENDIRSSFVFKTEEDFVALHGAIKNTLAVDNNKGWSLNTSLDVIAEENFLKNDELGFKLLESILNDYPTGLNVLYRTVKLITLKSKEWALRLWNLIKIWQHEFKLYWQLAFFDYLPSEYINSFYKVELLEVINSINQNCTLRFESFEKFQSVDKDILINLLRIVVDKIDKQSLRIDLWLHFFEKYSSQLAGQFDLLSKAYIQQQKISNHFDLKHEGLNALIQIDFRFLIEYVKAFYNERGNTHIQLPFVWDLQNYDSLVEEAINVMVANTTYFGILEHPLIIFFGRLNEEQKVKAGQFVSNYISKYHDDTTKMNAVFDMLRHIMKDSFEEYLLHYLSLNNDVEKFKKIWWRGNGGTYHGDVIIGEIHAKDWQNILTIVNKAANQLNLIPIKAYIKQQIESELKSAEWERKRKFTTPNW